MSVRKADRKLRKNATRTVSGGETTVAQLRRQNAVYRRQITGLRQENATLRQENQELRGVIDNILVRLKDLEERNAALEQENASLKQDNAALKQRLDQISLNYQEDKVITALTDVIGYEKFTVKNPIFQDVLLQRLKQSRHRMNHYILSKDDAVVHMWEQYLYDKLQELIREQSPILEHLDAFIRDLSGNTFSTLMAVLKKHLDQEKVVITDSERKFLDLWWQRGVI
jgi:regulator of replication initiation timing